MNSSAARDDINSLVGAGFSSGTTKWNKIDIIKVGRYLGTTDKAADVERLNHEYEPDRVIRSFDRAREARGASPEPR
jgi:hypothetical protein